MSDLTRPSADEQALLERWWEDRYGSRYARPVPIAAALAGAAFAAVGAAGANLRPHGLTEGWLLAAGLLPLVGALLARRVRESAFTLVTVPFIALPAAAAGLLLSESRAPRWPETPTGLVLLFGGVCGAYATLLVGTLMRRLGRYKDVDLLAELLEPPRRMVAAPDGPDAVVFLFAPALTRGAGTQVWVQLWRSPLRGRVTVQRRLHNAHGGLPHLGRLDLTPAEAEALLARAVAETLPSQPSRVRDGLPCLLQVLRRGRPDLQATVNLAGLPKGEAEQPAAALARAALEAAQRALAGGAR